MAYSDCRREFEVRTMTKSARVRTNVGMFSDVPKVEALMANAFEEVPILIAGEHKLANELFTNS